MNPPLLGVLFTRSALLALHPVGTLPENSSMPPFVRSSPKDGQTQLQVPVAPVIPVGPVGPVIPVAPVIPVEPVIPVAPVAPVAPSVYAQR